MKNLNISKEAIEKARHFYTLSKNAALDVYSSHSSADYIAELWNTDSSLTSQVVEYIIRDIGLLSNVTYCFTEALHKINDINFDDLCLEIIKNSSIHLMTRTIIRNCLILKEHKSSLELIKNKIRSVCRRSLSKNIQPVVIIDDIRELYLYQHGIAHKYIELDKNILSLHIALIKNLQKQTIHINEREVIETIIDATQQGDEYLQNILQDKEKSDFHKSTAIFMLGCNINPINYRLLNSYFEEYFYNRYTETCRELIGAVVYSCNIQDIETFLTDRLMALRNDCKMNGGIFYVNYRHKQCVILRLLDACASITITNEKLINEIFRLLEYNNKYIQVAAVLALEQQGIICSYQEKVLKKYLCSERSFRKTHIMACSDLCHLRPCVICRKSV